MGIVNPLTGEAVIDGTNVHVIYTGAAFIEIQQVLGLGIMDLVASMARGQRMGMVECVAVLRAGMEAWRQRTGAGGNSVTPAKALKLIDGYGLMKVWPILADSIKAAPSLGIRDDDDKDPAEEEDEDLDPGTGSEQ